MKFLHSPSSATPNYTATGCFPTVLRRLLRLHSLPTFPLDNNHIKDSCGSDQFDEVCCGDKLKGSPGIVGKLMGLDSMPGENSIEKWREMKLKRKGNCVLEAPSFVELENEKFIVLSFEGGGKDKELKLHCSRTRKGLSELKGKARNRSNQETRDCRSHEKDDGVVSSCKLSNLGENCKKLCDCECAKRGVSRNKKVEKAETESDSENSSPVSVLEFSDHQEASCSGKEDIKLKNSNSRRKLRGDLDKNALSPSTSSPSPKSMCSSVDDGDESCRSGKEYVGLGKKDFVIGESDEMWEEIGRMAEREVMDSSRVQMGRWKGEDFEEIVVCFESHILDQLILESFTIT